MDWSHRRAAYSRVPPLHLPQGACTRLCVLAQAKRSTANARALGGFRVAEPLMQRTGRLPVQVECRAGGMPCTEQCLGTIQNAIPVKSIATECGCFPNRPSRRRPVPSNSTSTTALTKASITAARLRNFTQDISEADFPVCSLQSPVITAVHSRPGPIENAVRRVFHCF